MQTADIYKEFKKYTLVAVLAVAKLIGFSVHYILPLISFYTFYTFRNQIEKNPNKNSGIKERKSNTIFTPKELSDKKLNLLKLNEEQGMLLKILSIYDGLSAESKDGQKFDVSEYKNVILCIAMDHEKMNEIPTKKINEYFDWKIEFFNQNQMQFDLCLPQGKIPENLVEEIMENMPDPRPDKINREINQAKWDAILKGDDIFEGNHFGLMIHCSNFFTYCILKIIIDKIVRGEREI